MLSCEYFKNRLGQRENLKQRREKSFDITHLIFFVISFQNHRRIPVGDSTKHHNDQCSNNEYELPVTRYLTFAITVHTTQDTPPATSVGTTFYT